MTTKCSKYIPRQQAEFSKRRNLFTAIIASSGYLSRADKFHLNPAMRTKKLFEMAGVWCTHL